MRIPSQIQGLLAAAMAVGLLASFGVFASNGSKPAPGAARSLEVLVYVEGHGQVLKQGGVPIQIDPLSGRGKCTDSNGTDYSKTNLAGDAVYQLRTSQSPGKDFGLVYLSQCDHGAYQISISVPAGYRLRDENQQNQTVRLQKGKTEHVTFILQQ